MMMRFYGRQKIVFPSKERGAVLIVSLVMLTILTIIAIGTTTDVGLQTNMAKNSQISLRAFNASLKKLNEEYTSMVISNTSDAILGNMLLTKNPITETTSHTTDNPFDLLFSIVYLKEDEDKNIHGNTVSSAMTPTSHVFEFNSESSLPNSDLGSNQTFGVSYTAPQ